MLDCLKKKKKKNVLDEETRPNSLYNRLLPNETVTLHSFITRWYLMINRKGFNSSSILFCSIFLKEKNKQFVVFIEFSSLF